MDLTALASVKMKTARSPKELGQLRSSVRTGLYLEVKAMADRLCEGKFSKTECSRLSLELVNRLCGDPATPGAAPLGPEASKALDAAFRNIMSTQSDIRIAVSFLRWARAAGNLMKMRHEEAQADLDSAVEMNPANALACCSLAYLAGFRGNPQRAVEYANQALKLDPEMSEAWIELGNAQEALGLHSEAQSSWNRAHRLSPELLGRSAVAAPREDRDPFERPTKYDVISDEPLT